MPHAYHKDGARRRTPHLQVFLEQSIALKPHCFQADQTAALSRGCLFEIAVECGVGIGVFRLCPARVDVAGGRGDSGRECLGDARGGVGWRKRCRGHDPVGRFRGDLAAFRQIHVI